MEGELARVRSFNRVVTQRVGALYEEYLGRSRALGASRLLWEIGASGADIRAIRERLDLDSGYASRLLRGLESDGLITLRPDPDDRRVRVAHLTAAGAAEVEELDRRSDELARCLLAPLSATQRGHLVEAMAAVERLLTAGLVTVEVEDPASTAAQRCLDAYVAELDARFTTGFDPRASLPATVQELTEPAGFLLLARLRGEPVGCGAVKLHGSRPAEIKRMWVAPAARGLGVGRRLLAELEQRARDRGVRVVRLETNETLREAIALYRASGYVEVPRFSDEPYAHHWFEKRLPARRPRRA